VNLALRRHRPPASRVSSETASTTPSTALARALDAGADAARAQGIDLAWVYDISGDDGRDGVRETLDVALSHRPAALIGSASASRKPRHPGRASGTSSLPPGPAGCTACPTRKRASGRGRSSIEASFARPAVKRRLLGPA
jgi:hypothetical protein